MEWNLRMVAAQHGIWRAADLRRLLAEAGLEISTGKMSHLWSGQPISIRLDDLEVICGVLDCDPGDLLVRDPAVGSAPGSQRAAATGQASARHPAAAGDGSLIQPAPRRGHRSMPPV